MVGLSAHPSANVQLFKIPYKSKKINTIAVRQGDRSDLYRLPCKGYIFLDGRYDLPRSNESKNILNTNCFHST